MRRNDNGDSFAVFFDMMTGLLFVFVIALVAYMLNFNDQHSEEMKLKSELKDLTFLRTRLLQDVSKQFTRSGIIHQVDYETSLIRLTDPALGFASGKAQLTYAQQTKLEAMSASLLRIVPCYTDLQAQRQYFSRCKKDMLGRLNSIIVEGHSDGVPLSKPRKRFSDNIELSFIRAKAFYDFLVNSPLQRLVNSQSQPIFTVSGQGFNRPLYPEQPEHALNRRIELRFVMNKNWMN